MIGSIENPKLDQLMEKQDKLFLFGENTNSDI